MEPSRCSLTFGDRLPTPPQPRKPTSGGKRPVRIREGGSIPIVGTFTQVLEVPVLLVGFGLPDDNLHSPNEKFNISHFYNGIRTVVRLIDRVGEAD